MSMVYLNGEWLALESAKISVLDRGFMFGDGVYEVVPVYSHKPFRLKDHLARLQHSLDGIRLPNPHNEAEWTTLIHQLIDLSPAQQDQYLYLQVTRGAAKRDHAFPEPAVAPTVLIMSAPLNAPSVELVQTGVQCITVPDCRWTRCDIKTISLLPNVLMRQAAADAHCAEAILIRDKQWVIEGSASNVFIIKDHTIIAPPKSNLMLPGITYDVVLEIAQQLNIPHQIRSIHVDELFSVNEVLITSSTKEILSVTHIDQQIIGTGTPGPTFTNLYQHYQIFKQKVMRA